jgi:hypothetical protein
LSSLTCFLQMLNQCDSQHELQRIISSICSDPDLHTIFPVGGIGVLLEELHESEGGGFYVKVPHCPRSRAQITNCAVFQHHSIVNLWAALGHGPDHCDLHTIFRNFLTEGLPPQTVASEPATKSCTSTGKRFSTKHSPSSLLCSEVQPPTQQRDPKAQNQGLLQFCCDSACRQLPDLNVRNAVLSCARAGAPGSSVEIVLIQAAYRKEKFADVRKLPAKAWYSVTLLRQVGMPCARRDAQYGWNCLCGERWDAHAPYAKSNRYQGRYANPNNYGPRRRALFWSRPCV